MKSIEIAYQTLTGLAGLAGLTWLAGLTGLTGLAGHLGFPGPKIAHSPRKITHNH